MVTPSQNIGSANGFKEALQVAITDGAEFILLLDDDNALEKGTLNILKEGWHANHGFAADNNRVVLDFRQDHQADVIDGISETRANQRPNSLLCFHILDLPFKFWSRTPWFRQSVGKKTTCDHGK